MYLEYKITVSTEKKNFFNTLIMSAREYTTPEILKEIIEDAISEDTGGVVMTVAEQLIKKGIAEGIAEGRAEGLIKGELIGDIRMAQLKKGMPVSAKEELEKLSTEELQRRLKDIS